MRTLYRNMQNYEDTPVLLLVRDQEKKVCKHCTSLPKMCVEEESVCLVILCVYATIHVCLCVGVQMGGYNQWLNMLYSLMHLLKSLT